MAGQGRKKLDPIPVAPLLGHLESNPLPPATGHDPELGTLWRILSRSRQSGVISFNDADKICGRVGTHMSSVYGSIYWSTPLTREKGREAA